MPPLSPPSLSTVAAVASAKVSTGGGKLGATKFLDGVRTFFRWFVYDKNGALNPLGKILSYVKEFAKENKIAFAILLLGTATIIVATLAFGIHLLSGTAIALICSCAVFIPCLGLTFVALASSESNPQEPVYAQFVPGQGPPPANDVENGLRPRLGELRNEAGRYEAFLRDYNSQICEELHDGVDLAAAKYSIPENANNDDWTAYFERETARLTKLSEKARNNSVLPKELGDSLLYFVSRIEDEFQRNGAIIDGGLKTAIVNHRLAIANACRSSD